MTNKDLLEARLSVLERQVKFLLNINGLDLSALRDVSDKELLKYYQDAVQLLGLRARQIPPEAAEHWADLFCQLSEVELVRLQQLVEYDHTWEPFYHLCIRMMTSVRQNKKLHSDVGLQHLYAFLEKGRKNIRDAAIIMIKKHQDTLPNKAKLLLRENDLFSLS